MAQPAITVMQPGDSQMHLSIAGAWASAALQRLDLARSAGPEFAPANFDAIGASMTTVLSFYLALSHAREVVRRAPWIGAPAPLDPDMLERLYRRGEQFRDALMHLGDKADRRVDFPPDPRTPTFDGRIRPPGGAVSFGLGFESEGAWLYAPLGRQATQRVSTRLLWVDVDQASRAIEAWSVDLLGRWADVQQLWAPYVEAHRSR